MGAFVCDKWFMSPVGEYWRVQNSDVLEWCIQKLIYFSGLNTTVLGKKKFWRSETPWFTLHRQYVYNRKIFKDVFRLENWSVYVVWTGSCNKQNFVLLCAGLYTKTSLGHLCFGYSGFGGLEVAWWPLVPKFVGLNPAEAVGFFRAKKSSARLPSEGK